MLARIQELERVLSLHDQVLRENAERHSAIERAFTEIAQHIQRQNTFNVSSKTTMASLVEEVKTHHGISKKLRGFSRTTNNTSQTMVLLPDR